MQDLFCIGIKIYLLFITYTMITGTSSLKSGHALRSGTHPLRHFYSYYYFTQSDRSGLNKKKKNFNLIYLLYMAAVVLVKHFFVVKFS